MTIYASSCFCSLALTPRIPQDPFFFSETWLSYSSVRPINFLSFDKGMKVGILVMFGLRHHLFITRPVFS